MQLAPSLRRLGRSSLGLIHGPTIGSEERMTTTAAPAASTASSRHRLVFSPRGTDAVGAPGGSVQPPVTPQAPQRPAT